MRTILAGLAITCLLWPSLGRAQGIQPIPTVPGRNTTEALTLTLDEAIQIALVGNYALRNTRLDVDNAAAQVREAWGQVMPQVSLASSYTRNLKSANPFAGSEAGSLFQSFGFLGWLSYNEQARTDDDPSTNPITFGEYADRQAEGMNKAGIVSSSGDNPFSVPNQFQNGITIEQTLFSGSAFAAISGAERFRNASEASARRQQQVLVGQVKQAFYQALLAAEQVQVSTQSVARARNTTQEVTRKVTQGVSPKYQRLSAEVDLANLETELVQVENAAATATDNLKLTLGIPMDQPIRLRGSLLTENRGDLLTVDEEDALARAFAQRPDLDQARLTIELREIDRSMTRSEYMPRVSAFANLSYTGSVPDNRSIVLSDPSDPFSYTKSQNSFFSSSYWNPSVNVGLSLSWNLFNGFQTSSRMQQKQIAVEKARTDYQLLEQNVRMEVDQALRNLRTANQRILAQQQNVERAELNYEFTRTRLAEGVATQLEERTASDQLDQSRLNHLQAMYDYLVAKTAFETSIGATLETVQDGRLTAN